METAQTAPAFCWRCPTCNHINFGLFVDPKLGEEELAAAREAATNDMGVDPSFLEDAMPVVMPETAFCVKCESQHFLDDAL